MHAPAAPASAAPQPTSTGSAQRRSVTFFCGGRLRSDEWWQVFFSSSGFTSGTCLNFEQDEEGLFCKLLKFYAGDRVHFTGIYELLCFGKFGQSHLAEIAAKHAETEILKVLDLETCGMCMSMEHHDGLSKVKDGCRKLALYNFDWFITTKGFRYLTVENLMDLLGDKSLLSESVETIQKAMKPANLNNISIELETVLNDYASIKRRNMGHRTKYEPRCDEQGSFASMLNDSSWGGYVLWSGRR
jgi:hypothetical protein